jgi:formylglycine-generating enzyme required for sulfatase activity
MDEKANGYRLPTFEEWEYAARGGQYFKYSGSDDHLEVAWNKEIIYSNAHPVAQKKANGYGLYDMSGNVWEWLWDASTNTMRYNRGGAWNSSALASEVSSRNVDVAANRRDGLGFRVVRNITVKTTVKTSENSGTSYEKVSVPDRKAKPSELIAIPGKNYEIGKTEVTQALYESVMGENPSVFRGENLPVENISYYDMLYFCNEYSRLSGLTPVYAVDDETDVRKWNYNPHKGEYLKGKITMDETANGYRLPTLDEWQYAAKGGESYKYSGSDNLNEVAWYFENSELTTHPVAQKKPNGYGLYDMSGNVMECVWYRQYGRETGIGIALGGTVYMQIRYFEVTGESDVYSKFERVWGRGFRLARNKN